jgi:hypothetical protein
MNVSVFGERVWAATAEFLEGWSGKISFGYLLES